MKEVIKILIAGAGVGAAVTQIMNITVWTWLDRPFSIGGEFIIPVMIMLVGYIGWKLSETYFYETRRQQIYQKGFDNGKKIHSYKIIIPDKEGVIDAEKDTDAA